MSLESIPFVLLGAGASVPASILTATDMTDKMLKAGESGSSLSLKPVHIRVIKFVAGGISMRRGADGENPLDGINIEDLFAAVQMLANRESLEITPFVAQWHYAVEEIDNSIEDSPPFHEENLHSAIQEALALVFHSASQESTTGSGVRRQPLGLNSDLIDASRQMARAIEEYVTDNESIWRKSAFVDTAHQMTIALKDLVWLEDASKTEYLDPLVKTIASHNGTIATLNYDNTIELAGDRLGVPVEVGLDNWSAKGSFAKPNTGIELLKLHGSIDWKISRKNIKIDDENDAALFRLNEVSRIKVDDDSAGHFGNEFKLPPSSNRGLIFGAGNKLTEEGPFLELFRTFEQRLENHDHLVTIGYSFGDQHINHVIFRWMNQKPDRELTVVDREGMTTHGHRLWQENPAIGKSSRVKLLPVGAKQGICDLFSEHN